jgi:HEAT repeat protein
MRRFLGVAVLLALAAAARGADVPALVKQLKGDDAEGRRAAAKALGEAGPEAKAAVPQLAAALKDPDLYVRRFAAQALGDIGPNARAAIPALNAVLKEGKDRREVLGAAATALGKIGVSVTQLAATVKDANQDPAVRRKAAEALGAMGERARDAVPALLEALKARPAGGAMPRDGDSRAEVAAALGDIAGPDDKAVVDTLTELSSDRMIRDRNLRQAINGALKKIKAKKS